MTVIKLVIIGLFIFIFFNLFQAVRIMRNPNPTQKMSKFFARRLMLSVLILLLILLATALGIITPNPRPY